MEWVKVILQEIHTQATKNFSKISSLKIEKWKIELVPLGW